MSTANIPNFVPPADGSAPGKLPQKRKAQDALQGELQGRPVKRQKREPADHPFQKRGQMPPEGTPDASKRRRVEKEPADIPPHLSSDVTELLSICPQGSEKRLLAPLKTLVHACASDEELRKIFNAIKAVRLEHREEAIRHTAKAVTKEHKGIDWYIAMRIWEKLHQAHKEQLLPHILTFAKSETALGLLNSIEQKQLTDILWHAVELCRNFSIPETSYYVLFGILNQISQHQERSDICYWTTLLCKALPNSRTVNLIEILAAVHHLPPEERAAAVTSTIPLLKDLENPYEAGALLGFVAKVDKNQRQDCVNHAKLLMHGCSGYGRGYLVQAFVDIDRKDRDEVASSLPPSLLGMTGGIERAELLRLHARLTPEQRAAVDRLVEQLLPGMDPEKSFFLRKLLDLDSTNGSSKIVTRLTEAMPLLQGVQNGLQAASLIWRLSRLSDESRDYLLRAHPFLDGVTSNQAPLLRAVLEHAPGPALEDAPDGAPPLQNFITSLLPLLSIVGADGNDRARVVQLLANDLFEHHRPLLHSYLQRMQADRSRALLAVLASPVTTFSMWHILTHAGRLLEAADPSEFTGIFTTLRRLTHREIEIILARDDVLNLASLIRAVEAIQELPLESAPSQEPYRISVVAEELENTPLLLLDTLSSRFAQHAANFLHVTYEQEAGQDAGGLGRQFVSELVGNLVIKLGCREMGTSGLYRPTLHPTAHAGGAGTGFSCSDEERATLQKMGQLFMFCLNASRDYPTGIHFDQGVFTAILSFSEALLEKEFDSLDLQDEKVFTELLAIFEKMNGHIESEMAAVVGLKKYLSPLPTEDEEKEKFLKVLFSIVEAEPSIHALNMPKQPPAHLLEPHYDKMQAALKGFISQQILRPTLLPLLEIAKGMRSAPFKNKRSFQSLHTLTASALSDLLQGTLTPAKIVEKLTFAASIAPEKRQWLITWIEKTDEEQRKRFLFALTGSRAIGAHGITIRPALGEDAHIYFHTCFNSVDFPFDRIASEEEFRTILEANLSGSKYNRA